MKKFITLLLVLAGYVCTVSATEYTVIFKPSTNWADNSAWFALYMENNSNEGTKVAFAETSTGSGYYKATYNSSYDKKIQICRMNPVSESLEHSNVWTWSADLVCPNSDILIDNSKDSDWSFSTTETSLHSSWLLAANRHIANDYKDWNGSTSENENNVMTSTDGINYTVTVSSRPIKAGYYGYKFVGDDWYGDDYGNNYYIEISNDDFYDITYTFNRITKKGSAIAEAKNLSPTITYSYYIYDNDASSWKYDGDNAITAFTGKSWYECEMTNINGTYIYSIPGKELTSGNRYGARLVEKIAATDASDKYNWIWISDDQGGSQGCRYYDCTSNGTYNILFTYKPSDTNNDISSNQPGLSVTQGFYAAESTNWSTGYAMTFDADNGVYKTTLEGINGKYFALSTASDITSDDWAHAIRPEYGESGSYDVNAFSMFSGTAVTTGKKTWYLNATGIDNVEISFRPTDYHWEVTPYIVKDFTGAPSEDGSYLTTFSNTNYAVAIPDGVTAYYADKTNSGSGVVKMVAFENGIAANTGAFLKANEAKEYHFTPATTTDEVASNNLFVAGNGVPSESSAYRYVFANQGDDLGFYKMGSSFNVDMTGKAYLESATSLAPTSARVAIVFDDDVTGINSVNRETINNNEYYNLAGQRVAQPAKGLYIVNGKKVVIR